MRKEAQPVPDQRYYTKTNFFTITNGEGGDQSMSIADKYAHMHSQKMSRRQNQQNDTIQSPNQQQIHARMQSFTDGMHGGNSQKQILAGSQPNIDQEYYQNKNRLAKNKFVLRPIDEMQGPPGQ